MKMRKRNGGRRKIQEKTIPRKKYLIFVRKGRENPVCFFFFGFFVALLTFLCKEATLLRSLFCRAWSDSCTRKTCLRSVVKRAMVVFSSKIKMVKKKKTTCNKIRIAKKNRWQGALAIIQKQQGVEKEEVTGY